MKSAGVLLGKELSEMWRTWRLPVLGGLVAFFAITGPVLALYTPEIISSLQSSQPGVVIEIPDPTWVDAYAQWVKNLSQIFALLVIIVAAGSVAGEVAGGTAALTLVKPVSRRAFVAIKAAAIAILVTATVVAGTALTQLVTYVTFGEAPTAALWEPTLVWIAFACLLVAVATLFSTRMPTLAAAGVALGVLFALSLGSLWKPLVEYSPVGLLAAPADLLVGKEVVLGWPLATTAVAALACVAVGALLFERREL